MKYSQELKEAMISLTDRYGITLSEVPDRFKEKLLQIVGTQHREEINHAFKPLELGYLRNLRIRATHKIEAPKLVETGQLIATIEDFSQQDTIDSIELWSEIFKVRTDESFAEIDHEEFFADSAEIVADIAPIIDDISISAPRDVEIVVNQFDSTVPVDEPQVEDYDGHFSDKSFETVADFSISDAENSLIGQLESSTSIDEVIRAESAQAEKKRKARSAPKPSSTPAPADPKSQSLFADQPPWEKNAASGTVDGAFKALRDGNPALASRIMMELARNGDTRAQFHLGEFYLQGTGIEVSQEKGKYWLRKAAGRGSIAAKSKLEEIENEANSGGCCGCVITGGVVLLVLKVLSELI